MLKNERSQIILSGKGDTQEAVLSSIETKTGEINFAVILGDITQINYDAIAIPANPSFEYSGMGVQSAVARKAGIEPFQEAEIKAKALITSGEGVEHMKDHIGVPLAFATATNSGRLENVKKIIHVNNMRTEEDLPECDQGVVRLSVSSSLAVADSEGLTSVVFPALGTGLWGMSLAESLAGTIEGMKDYFQDINPNSKIRKVGFVIYAEPTLENAQEVKKVLLTEVFPKLLK
jgi:O-acetyl-ADP-ribose deacetylase (regulator of RNase III)